MAQLIQREPKEIIQDELVFLREWLGNPLRTGAVSPSGRWLARAMADEVDPARPGPVVELGPGTGVFTKALIDRGVEEHRLVLIEANQDFARMLARRFPRSRVICGDAYAIDRHLDPRAGGAASAVVTGLPLLTKPVDQRVALIEACLGCSRPGAPVIQFTYGLQPPAPAHLGSFDVRRGRRVLRNFPPATVWVYNRPSA